MSKRSGGLFTLFCVHDVSLFDSYFWLFIQISISSKIFNLEHLITLYLQENYLTWIIPLNIQNGKLLQELRLDRNNLTGTIPLGIGNLPLLANFTWQNYYYNVPNLSHNSLTGEILETLGNMTQLDLLDLSNNKLKN